MILASGKRNQRRRELICTGCGVASAILAQFIVVRVYEGDTARYCHSLCGRCARTFTNRTRALQACAPKGENWMFVVREHTGWGIQYWDEIAIQYCEEAH